MKNSRTLAVGILLGIMAILSMGIVFIDNINHYWRVGGASGEYVQLYVSNNFVMGVNTNTGRIGIGSSNANTLYLDIVGPMPRTNATGAGTSANTSGRIGITAGQGGSTFDTADATAGGAGQVVLAAGRGGTLPPLALTNATAGSGATVTISSGAGGLASSGVATQSVTGGNGGSFSLTASVGTSPSVAATNAVGGNGGAVTVSAGAGGSPSAGWSRKGGNGGAITYTAGNGGDAVRTNAGPGASINLTAGSGGQNSTTPGDGGAPGAINLTAGNAGSTAAGGNPSPGAAISLTAGAGSTGTTNSDGGHVFIAGGAPGSGAVPGNVVLARLSGGTSRGAGVQIGPAVAGIATITNVLGAAASLDFPSTLAGTFSDLVITVTGATSNNVAVCLSTPWMCATNGGSYFTYASNDTIYVRFLNHNLVTAIDPVPGTFSVVAFRIR